MEYDESLIITRLHTESILSLNFDFPKIPTSHFTILAFTYLAQHISSQSGNMTASDVNFVTSAIAGIKTVLDLIKLDTYELFEAFDNKFAELKINSSHGFYEDQKINIANYLADQFISEKFGIEQTHPSIVASLAGCIQASIGNGTIVETIPITAEISLGKSIQHDHRSFPMEKPSQVLLTHIISLKLILNGIEAYFVDKHEYISQKYHGTTFLVDSPFTAEERADIPSAAQKLSEILADFKLPGRFLLITPNMKSHRAEINRLIRPQLNNDLHLDAIIRFSSSDLPNKSAGCLLTILSQEIQNRNDLTLYLDVSNSNKALSELDPQERAILAGNIYNIHQNRGLSPTKKSTPPKVVTILNAQFSLGYRDIKNLCIALPHIHKSSINFASVASLQNRFQNDAQTISFSADLREIAKRLRDKNHPTCTYIIGNNGAGKSLLLRELIDQIPEQSTVGISTGINDRFPKGGSNHRNFEYKGVRTGSQSITISKISRNTTKIAAGIFKSQQRLDALTECLECLGYKANYYFTLKPETVLDQTPADIQFRPLSSIAHNNRIPQNLEDYEFGVVRLGDYERVTPYSALSSGEQNINYLLLSIITAEREGKVFLIDEPEISLHLQWQQTLPKVFHILSRRFGISFVVATHSPTLVSNASNPNTYSYQLHQGDLRLLSDEERFSVESIILDGFKTYTPNNREVHEKCARLVARTMAARNDPDAQTGNDILSELSKLEDLITTSQGQYAAPGLEDDLDLIKKAYAAIELLINDQKPNVGLARRDGGV